MGDFDALRVEKIVVLAKKSVYSSVWRCLHCDSHVKVRLTEKETKTQVLQNSLKKAKATAQGIPLGVQLDEEHAKEARLFEEAKQRVARLRSELAAESHPQANFWWPKNFCTI